MTEPVDIEEFRPTRAASANQVAEDILEAVALLQGPSGAVYEYLAAGYWRERSDDYLRALAKRHDAATKSARRSEIVDYLKASVHDSDLEWGRVADTEIACANGIVDVVSGRVRPHDPDNRLDSVIPHDYVPAAQSERWMEALDQWFGEDVQRYDALQEYIGYICLSHAKFKKAALLSGPSHAGKSVVLGVMRRLVGKQWISALPIRDMNDSRRCCAMLHKRLNLVGEVGADEIMRSAGFNKIVSTEEPIDMDPKYLQPFAAVLPIKVVIACNELPNILERSGATINRLLFIPFDREIPEQDRDPALAEALEAEIPGILSWAVVGARRLIENAGVFTVIGSAAEMLADLRDEANPIIGFVENEMYPQAGEHTPLVDIVKRYNERRYGRATTTRSIARWLRAAFGPGATHKMRHGDTTPVCFVDYALRIAPPP